MVQDPYVESGRARIDVVRGTNYLLESLGIDHRIRSTAEFASPVLIPIYEKICSCRLADVRVPVRNLGDEIHNIQSLINALCFDTVEFDLSHISGEQVANGDRYAMEDLLEILTDVYHWIKNDRPTSDDNAFLNPIHTLPLSSDRSSIQPSSLGAQIAHLADRRRIYDHDRAPADDFVYTEISPIGSPKNSPSRRRYIDDNEHDTAVEDLQEKYQSLLHRFEKTVQMSSEALNLSRLSQTTPPAVKSDLRLLLHDLNNDKQNKQRPTRSTNAYDVNTGRYSNDIEDDLAVLLNDNQERRLQGQIESQVANNQPSKSGLQESMMTTTTNATGRNPLNRSDEFYQIRNQLREQYQYRSNLNHVLERNFQDDFEDYKSTKKLLREDQTRRATEHHEIDTSSLRLDDSESHAKARRPRSTSARRRQSSSRKGFLRRSSVTLNTQPIVNRQEFDESAATSNDDVLGRNVQMTNKHRLLLGNEHDIVHVLNEQFPGIYVSNETQAKLNDQFSKHIDNLFKSRMELLNAQQGNLNDVELAKRKHDQRTDLMRKELSALQRQQDIQLKHSAERILKSKIRDQRIQQARVRRYFQQYCLDQRKRLLKKRTNEELILKQAYKDAIRIQRERLQEMKKYKKEYNTLFLSRYRNQLESLENYYRQRLDMFKELQQQEAVIQRTQDREEKLELSKQRAQLRRQLESDIKQLQDHMNQNDDYIHFRQLDLERLKENIVQARITTKV